VSLVIVSSPVGWAIGAFGAFAAFMSSEFSSVENNQFGITTGIEGFREKMYRYPAKKVVPSDIYKRAVEILKSNFENGNKSNTTENETP
jgi:hypothetical protein